MSTAIENTQKHHDIVLTPDRPWLGLASFSRAHRHYFFGRNNDTKDLVDRLMHRRLTVLFGKSGLGKTSLLQAGVIRQLDNKNYEPIYIRLAFDDDSPSPEQQVVERILDALAYGMPDEDLDCIGLWDLLKDPLYGLANRDSSRAVKVVLIFDQFEELYTLGESNNSSETNSFLDTLSALVENRPTKSALARMEQDQQFCDRVGGAYSHCKFLISLREDYLHLLERWRTSMPSVMDNRFELHPLSGLEALEAVVGPAGKRAKKNIAHQPILDEDTAKAIVRLVAGINDQTVPLEELNNIPPLLNLVCERLNEIRIKNGNETIQLPDVQGSVNRVLDSYYESCFKGMTDGARAFVEDRLVSAAGFRQPTNHDTAIAELTRLDVKEPGRVLDTLIDRRLISIEERGGVSRLELTHDILTTIVAKSRNRRAEEEAFEARRFASQEKYQQRIRYMLIGIFASGIIAIGSLSLIGSFKAAELRAKTAENAEREAANTAKLANVGLAKANDKLTANARELERIAKDREREREEALLEKRKAVKLNQQLELEKRQVQKSIEQASEASFLYGQKLLSEEQHGNNAFNFTGQSKFQQAVAHWIRAIELNPANTHAARALYISLNKRAGTELRLPISDDWKIPPSVKNPVISSTGKYVYWKEENTVHVRGKGFSWDFDVSPSTKRIRFDNSGDWLLTYDKDSASVFDIESKTSIKRYSDWKNGSPISFCISRSHNIGIVTLAKRVDDPGAGGRVSIIDLESGKENYHLDFPGAMQRVERDLLYNGGFLLSFKEDNNWKLAFNRYQATVENPRPRYYYFEKGDGDAEGDLLLFGNDKTDQVVVKSRSGLQFINSKTLLRGTKIRHSFFQSSFKLSQSGRYVVEFGGVPPCGATTTSNVQLYEASGGAFSLSLSVPADNEPIFSRDDRFIAVLTSDGRIVAYSLANLRKLIDFMPSVPCKQIGIDDDNNSIVALGMDNKIRTTYLNEQASHSEAKSVDLKLAATYRQKNDPESVLEALPNGLSISFDPVASEFRIDQPGVSLFFNAEFGDSRNEKAILPALPNTVVDANHEKCASLKTLESGTYELTVIDNDGETSKSPFQIEEGMSARLLAVSSQGNYVAFLVESRIYLWDYEKHKVRGNPWAIGANQSVITARFHPFKPQLVVEQAVKMTCGDSAPTAVVFQLGKDHPISMLGCPGGIKRVKFINDPSSNAVLVLGRNNTLKVVNSLNGLPISVVTKIPENCIDVAYGDGCAILVTPTKLHKLPIVLFNDDDSHLANIELPAAVSEWCTQLVGLRLRDDGGFSVIAEHNRARYFRKDHSLPPPWSEVEAKLRQK